MTSHRCLSGKLWYLQHHCVGDTTVYHYASDMSIMVSQITGNSNSLFRLRTEETSKLCITGPLWGESMLCQLHAIFNDAKSTHWGRVMHMSQWIRHSLIQIFACRLSDKGITTILHRAVDTYTHYLLVFIHKSLSTNLKKTWGHFFLKMTFMEIRWLQEVSSKKIIYFHNGIS